LPFTGGSGKRNESLSRISKEITDRHFWKHFSRENRLFHIEFKQVRYTTMEEAEKGTKHQEIGQENVKVAPMPDSAELLAIGFQELDEEDLIRLPQAIRCLLTSANNIKLYPARHPGQAACLHSITDRRRSFC